MTDLSTERKRKFRYAVGYMIDQEGEEIVERLVRDGTHSRFGVRSDWVPGTDLNNLTRPEAEELLKEREWIFRNYHKIDDALTLPAKIFDTQILFSPNVAIKKAKRALFQIGHERVKINNRLDALTRDLIELADPDEFLDQYTIELENFVIQNYNGRSALLRRVNNRPFRNVNASITSL
jgi:hypothetical protein